MTPAGPSQAGAGEGAAFDRRPPLLAVDAGGYVWRCYDTGWSMAPVNPDNQPVPEPVTYYAPVSDAVPDGLPDMWTPEPDDHDGIEQHALDYANRDLHRVLNLLIRPDLTPEAQLLMARSHAALSVARIERLTSRLLTFEPPGDQHGAGEAAP